MDMYTAFSDEWNDLLRFSTEALISVMILEGCILLIRIIVIHSRAVQRGTFYLEGS